MNEEFITEAIQDERCLKARKLLDRFETEIENELKSMGREAVDRNPQLFQYTPEEADPNVKFSWNTSTIITNIRANLQMSRVSKEDESDRLYLNISLRWVDPIEWGEEDIEGVLCAACYKINGGDMDDFQEVKRDTLESDWSVRFGEDQYNNAPGVMYIPVGSGEELRNANKILIDHFTEFGDYWGLEEPEEDL